MKRPPIPDPVTPQVRFDNYVLHETVQAHPVPVRRVPVTSGVLAVGTIGVLTFALGMMIAVQFLGNGRSDVADAPMPAAPALAEVLRARADDAVTRLDGADIIAPAGAPAPQTALINDLQAAVLKGLQPERTVGKLTLDEMARKSIEAQEIVNRNKMRMLREGVLAGVYRVEVEDSGGKKRLGLRTVNAAMTQASVGNLLVAAARRGEIELPPSLNTAEGDVDQDTLLFNLVQTSLANDGTPEGAEAAREMGRRAFAASSARTREVRGERVYQVERGDSLAYISLQFYGRPNAYMRIFEANRDKLRSPDEIKIGQRLIIPQ
ncbi:MAG: LysM peptidoglycan-binding domain-containing protein [Pseudomonadota bacterium]